MSFLGALTPSALSSSDAYEALACARPHMSSTGPRPEVENSREQPGVQGAEKQLGEGRRCAEEQRRLTLADEFLHGACADPFSFRGSMALRHSSERISMVASSKLLSLVVSLFVSLFVSAAVAADEAPWMGQVAQALGKKGGAMPGGVYRVGLARSDIKATLDGVELKPAFALGSWLAFTNAGNHGAVMGDLVLLSTEVNPVMKKLQEGGIEITALHNHLLRNEPFTMYMHVMGHGDPAKLAAALHDALQESKTPLSDSPAGAAPAALDLDTAAVDTALGRKGKANGGVYQFSIPRA